MALSLASAHWFANTLEDCSLSEGRTDFCMVVQDGIRQFFAQHCSDAFRCYLEPAEYGSNGRRGVLVISEGMEGIGWQSLFFADKV